MMYVQCLAETFYLAATLHNGHYLHSVFMYYVLHCIVCTLWIQLSVLDLRLLQLSRSECKQRQVNRTIMDGKTKE